MIQVEKTQDVRLIDIFLLGPFMIWFGGRAQGIPDWARALMVLSGAATMAYNYSTWRNTLELEQQLEAEPDRGG